MTTYHQPEVEGIELDDRSVKALTTPMTVIDDCGDVRGAARLYEVTTEKAYLVDLETESCTCPDHEYNQPDGGCKHLRRVRYEIGETPIPSWVDESELDDQLGMHVTTGAPRFAGADLDDSKSEPNADTSTEIAANETTSKPKVATDGGQNVGSLAESGASDESGGYSSHYEPLAQGGEKYVRCGDCGRELLVELGGKDNLPHAPGCSNNARMGGVR